MRAKADVHRSFGAIGHDLVHAIFHFEGKLWNTLPLLAWRPGDLTRRYIHGERARFISPLALFLFAVFLTYAVLSMVGAGGGVGEEIARAAAEQTRSNAIRSSLQDEVERVETRLTDKSCLPPNGGSWRANAIRSRKAPTIWAWRAA